MKENKDIRIIQTFWSGGHNPLECGYGWSHAEGCEDDRKDYPTCDEGGTGAGGNAGGEAT